MARQWLLVDANYLCWRAFHSTGSLSHGALATGVIFGFMRAVRDLRKTAFNGIENDKVIFMFDHGKNKRLKLYPQYKSTRRKMRENMDPETKEEYKEMRNQVEKLKHKYLRRLGYRNIWFQDGYEADDLIAAFIKDKLPENDTAVIVSGDGDLLQLIDKNRVTVYNPSRMTLMNKELFTRKYGLRNPKLFANVKAIAGCKTDDIQGVPHVGEKTAIKYLKLVEECKKKPRVLKPSELSLLARVNKYPIRTQNNFVLVRLPMKGTKTFTIYKDKLTKKRWNKVATSLGMKSLVTKGDAVTQRQRIRRGFTFE